MLARIDAALAQAALTAEEKALALVDTGLHRWEWAAETGDTKARALLAEVERVSAETKARVFDELAAAEERLEILQQRIHETAGDMEAQMRTAWMMPRTRPWFWCKRNWTKGIAPQSRYIPSLRGKFVLIHSTNKKCFSVYF